MTTRDFIAKTYNTTNDKWGTHGYERWCSSVKTDKHGTVYSYGYHYPLAFNVAGLDFVNNSGYSSTTAKHIAWAQSAIGYGKYINVKPNREEAQIVSSEYESDEKKLKAIQSALIRELTDITVQMKSKKRKDTQVYRSLSVQQTSLIDSLARTKVVA